MTISIFSTQAQATLISSSPPSHLSEAQFAVKIFIHFLDHVLQAQMSLWSSQLLHQYLQLHQVDEAIFSRVKPENSKKAAEVRGR